VALVGLEPELLAAVARSCGPDAVWVEADVSDAVAVAAAVDEAAAQLGGIDVVIANAGVAAIGTVRTIDPAAFERVIEVNLLGVWRTVRAALPHVIKNRGYVLPVASVAAAAHAPGMSAYCASKAGVEAFANSLRQEVRELGVDVGVAYFSWIATDMVRGAETLPTFQRFREKLTGPAAKTYPLSDAVDSVVHGIENRARVVTAPGWVRILLTWRGIIQPLGERQSRRWAGELVEMAEADVAERGAVEASRPGGPSRVGLEPPA
jgi:NAD(P)-dependent dehydrogenase (short-subunit alcohol dehydrogenase family)